MGSCDWNTKEHRIDKNNLLKLQNDKPNKQITLAIKIIIRLFSYKKIMKVHEIISILANKISVFLQFQKICFLVTREETEDTCCIKRQS